MMSVYIIRSYGTPWMQRGLAHYRHCGIANPPYSSFLPHLWQFCRFELFYSPIIPHYLK